MATFHAIAFPAKVAGCAAIVLSSIVILGGCTSAKLLTLGDPGWQPRVVEGPTLVDLAPFPDKDVSNATLTEDLLEIFFSTDNDIWTSSRSSSSAPFEMPVRLDAVNSDKRESSPAISLDGLTLWFSSARPGGIGQQDIWVSKRSSRTADWLPPTNCTTLNSVGDDLPRPPGNHELVMPLSVVRDPEAGKLYDIFFATRPNRDTDFETPIRAPELPHPPVNSSTDAFLTADGLGLFYSGSLAWQQFDIVFAHHSAWGETFGDFQLLDAIDTAKWRENDPWLSPDGSTLYFTSNRTGLDGGALSETGALPDGESPLDRIYRVVLDPPWTP